MSKVSVITTAWRRLNARLPTARRDDRRDVSAAELLHREVILMVSTALAKSATFVLVAALSLSAPSRADILTRCTAAEHFSCYSSRLMAPEEQSDPMNDGTSEGEIVPSIGNEDEADSIYKDASGIRSIEGEDLKFLTLPSDDAFLAVAIDTGTPVLEYYFFKLANSGGGTVVWAPLARAPDSSRRVR
jgi:hypothetical protein